MCYHFYLSHTRVVITSWNRYIITRFSCSGSSVVYYVSFVYFDHMTNPGAFTRYFKFLLVTYYFCFKFSYQWWLFLQPQTIPYLVHPATYSTSQKPKTQLSTPILTKEHNNIVYVAFIYFTPNKFLVTRSVSGTKYCVIIILSLDTN